MKNLKDEVLAALNDAETCVMQQYPVRALAFVSNIISGSTGLTLFKSPRDVLLETIQGFKKALESEHPVNVYNNALGTLEKLTDNENRDRVVRSLKEISEKVKVADQDAMEKSKLKQEQEQKTAEKKSETKKKVEKEKNDDLRTWALTDNTSVAHSEPLDITLAVPHAQTKMKRP